MQLAHKVVVVTGGGNGIGRQVALELVRRGARVAVADRNPDGLEQTRGLAADRDAVSTHVVDVTDREAVAALPAAVVEAHGQVDGLINVAGIIHRFAPMTELSRDELERIVDVNFWGTVTTALAFVPVLRERPEASIVNVASLSGLLAFAGQGFYSATKGAVKLFSEALYEELVETSVAVTTVFPGNISTDISGNSGVTALDPKGRKVRATTPERTAEQIVDGVETGRARVVIGSDARLLDILARVAPTRAAKLIAAQMKSVL